jgi:hypothetical protein
METATNGTVIIYNEDGMELRSQQFDLVANGYAKFRVSDLLSGFGDATAPSFGTLEVHIAIPFAVKEHLNGQKPFYFWDRFYIGYTTSLGQTCFVHGIDKTHIYRDGQADSSDWHKPGQAWNWAPEIPVNINDYEKFSVIMVNRTSGDAEVTLTLSDTDDASLSWRRQIPPKGVRLFELNSELTGDLNPNELRMELSGMATQFGRPAVFKQFANGAISVMHC